MRLCSYVRKKPMFTFKKTAKDNSAFDFIIVGLGNPGKEYQSTRHNCGFIALDYIAEKENVKINRLKFKSLTGDVRINGKRCLLLKPSTFMNLSGTAVKEAMDFYKTEPERVIIIYDDISLDTGKIRIKRKGSDGGQKGMKNIIYLSGSDSFPRIKVGIGPKPHEDYDLKDFVLSKFTKEDAEKIKEILPKIHHAVTLITDGNIDKAMNLYN